MNLDDAAKNLIILHDPSSDAAKALLGAVLPAFGVVIARLFGNNPAA